MNPNYHHGDLKTELLSYAREQLESANLEGLSMREMAKAVGVSHTAAYRHFKDKQALLEAAAVEGFEELLASSQAAVAAAQTPRERLKACGMAYVAYGLQSPQLLSHMFRAASQADASAALQDAAARLFETLKLLVSEGQQQGVFGEGPPTPLAHTCWAMVHGLATLMSNGLLQLSQSSPDALMAYADGILEVFLEGQIQKSRT